MLILIQFLTKLKQITITSVYNAHCTVLWIFKGYLIDLNSNQVQALPVTVNLPKQHKVSLKNRNLHPTEQCSGISSHQT